MTKEPNGTAPDLMHVLALVEAIHGAHLDAVHDFAANAALIDETTRRAACKNHS
jgi:hypothetical protein